MLVFPPSGYLCTMRGREGGEPARPLQCHYIPRAPQGDAISKKNTGVHSYQAQNLALSAQVRIFARKAAAMHVPNEPYSQGSICQKITQLQQGAVLGPFCARIRNVFQVASIPLLNDTGPGSSDSILSRGVYP